MVLERMVDAAESCRLAGSVAEAVEPLLVLEREMLKSHGSKCAAVLLSSEDAFDGREVQGIGYP